MGRHPTPSFRDSLVNLRRAESLRDAVRGLLANNWIKLRRLDNCCGNYGDPGC